MQALLKTSIKTALFHSPNGLSLSVEEVLTRLDAFIKAFPEFKYKIVIGTDSQANDHGSGFIDYVSAIIVHRVGHGAIYFWTRFAEPKTHSLRERIYNEAFLSLKVAQDLMEDFNRLGMLKYELEIHVDIGAVGETRTLIAEVTGMIRANGFNVKTKPESFGASKVADRYT